MGSIYVITNNINQKQYVGMTTKTLNQRLHEHVKASSCLKNSMLICRAIYKYGKENFSIDLLESCADMKNLPDLERKWIQDMKTYVHEHPEHGYNVTLGGEGQLGLKHTQKTKEKIKLAMTGHLNPFYGKKHSPQVIELIKEKNTGRKFTIEQREKLSKALIGRVCSDEQKQKSSISNRGQKRSIETCKRISDSKRGKPSQLRGKKSTKETCKRISDSKRGKPGRFWKQSERESVGRAHSRSVKQTLNGIDTNFISIKNASDFTGFPRTSLQYALKHQKQMSDGSTWSYVGFPKRKPAKQRLYSGRHVLQFDSSGNIIGKYNSIVLAARAVGCKPSSIRNACLGTLNFVKGFNWKFAS